LSHYLNNKLCHNCNKCSHKWTKRK
jgi:hypothetical protein